MNAKPADLLGKKRRRGGIFWRLRRWFMAGLLATAPIGLTVWLVLAIVDWIDAQVQPLLPPDWWPSQYLPFDIPGIGLVVALIGITVIGALTAGFVGRLLMNTYEGLLARMPVIRGIYSFLKQAMEMVFESQSGSFRQVVLVQFPRPGSWALGFITGVTHGEIQDVTEDELVNVFVPATPPASGFLLFVPRGDLILLSMTVEEGIKMVVSGGIVTPEDRRTPEQREQPSVPTLAGDLTAEGEEPRPPKGAAAGDSA